MIAFVVLDDGGAEDEVVTSLERFATENLERFERPTKYIVKDKLPLTTVGKVNYRALEKEVEAGE